MQHLAAMEPNTDLAGHPSLGTTSRANLAGCCLHGEGGADRLLMSQRIRLRAAKNREDRVTDEFVDGAVMLVRRTDQRGKIIVQQINHLVRVHIDRKRVV